MPTADHNRKRIFAELLTVEAWHEEFSAERMKADLHADVVFMTARIGGEAESNVRFRLSLRRAEVVVVIPKNEPVIVDKKSVSRDAPELTARRTRIIESTNNSERAGSLGLSLSSKGSDTFANAKLTAGQRTKHLEKFESDDKVKTMCVTQSSTEEGYYRWSIVPSYGDVLAGRPWEANDVRLSLQCNSGSAISPSVRVEVRCLREDLLIEDIEIKDETRWEGIISKLGFENRRAAAESYIRDRLTIMGLEVGNLDDKFSKLVLGSVTADSV